MAFTPIERTPDSANELELTSRKQARSVENILKKIKSYTTGWLGYYSIVDMERKIKETLIKSFVHIAQSDFLLGCTNKPQ